ncbi:uncharacterized protein LOC113508001 isoform X1 [Trichoplusia ni]|uniref:Uncharacterized protein LOC113508001 isoform X1 n=1 Tax=Trichoplusia ni TaxID=7111 RepID=A0A7E5X0P6_TRINI|nr:uncharacterized protein LOC113508001 isoform X1 [Trichoplusia ni]
MAAMTFKSTVSCLFFIIQLAAQVSAGTQFASHVSVNTPARSFTHGVGDPVSSFARRNYNTRQSSSRSLQHPAAQSRGTGYARIRPSIPFINEDVHHDNTINVSPWQYNNYRDIAIPVLPPSPYKVDSPDPESLWPEGLFLPPINAPRFGAISNRRSEVLSEAEGYDPYLLEASEAVAAVKRADGHGVYYFHNIPHIESLLANQELRIKNNLKPHRIASIRHTWPYNRP